MRKQTTQKPYWEMTTEELAEATKQFDDPHYDPPALEPTPEERAQLRQWRKRRKTERARLTLRMDLRLIEETDEYAAERGLTFSEVVSEALRRMMKKKKSA